MKQRLQAQSTLRLSFTLLHHSVNFPNPPSRNIFGVSSIPARALRYP
jgi:hypothetical protein